MKCTIPEISWHNRDPVLSLDVQQNSPDGIYRLATGGTDSHVVVWQLRILDTGAVSVEMLCDLTKHNRAVNAVRFSPNGLMLASSDDESSLIIWKKQEMEAPMNDIFADDGGRENKENWTIFKILRGHIEDIYDLSWSSCSSFLISGSVDNTAIMWNISKGKNIALLKDHKGFVQGVAWDPLNQYVATLCSDRCLRLFNVNNKKTAYKAQKMQLPKHLGTDKQTKLFYDDTLKSFCRRLSFSPDGEVIVAPSGIFEKEDGKNMCGTYIFSRYSPLKPVVFLPTGENYTLAVRFCPLLFELNPLLEKDVVFDKSAEDPWKQYSNLLCLPYRMIYAVATRNFIILYDTQQPTPFAKISNIHYTRLSDISWSDDGRILVVASTDGYCSLISFNENELGKPYCPDEKSTENSTSEILTEEKMEVDEVPKKDTEQDAPENLNKKNVLVPTSLNIKPSKDILKSTEITASEKSEKVSEEKDVGEKKEAELKSIEDNSKSAETKPSEKVPTPIIAKPIEVKRKPGKRISLITLSKPSTSKEQPPQIEGKPSTPKEPPPQLEAKPSTSKEQPPQIQAKVDQPKGQVQPQTDIKNTNKDVEISNCEINKDEDSNCMLKDSSLASSPMKNLSSPRKPNIVGNRTPRRVSLITLSSPKGKKDAK